LRRIHIPHKAIYAAFAIALFGCLFVFGFLSSYARMSWKVSNYNSLRQEVDSLRTRYQELQRVTNQKNEQLATLQTFASEVSVAYGLKRKPETSTDVANGVRDCLEAVAEDVTSRQVVPFLKHLAQGS